jgi:hypothetical protein
MDETDAGTITPPPGSPAIPPWLARLGAVSWRLLAVIALGAVLASIAFTISTVSVYPHDTSDQGLPPTMQQMARQTKGQSSVAPVRCLMDRPFVSSSMTKEAHPRPMARSASLHKSLS